MTELPTALEILTTGVLWTVALALIWVWLSGIRDLVNDHRRTDK